MLSLLSCPLLSFLMFSPVLTSSLFSFSLFSALCFHLLPRFHFPFLPILVFPLLPSYAHFYLFPPSLLSSLLYIFSSLFLILKMVVESVNAMYRCCRQHTALAVKRFSYIPRRDHAASFLCFTQINLPDRLDRYRHNKNGRTEGVGSKVIGL
jgi:hypothetical protein